MACGIVRSDIFKRVKEKSIMAQKIRFKRVLLKLSGETLGGKGGFGIDIRAAEYVAREVVSTHALGCEIAIVIGGGNFIRGEKLSHMGIDRATADQMGMLGTVINALVLQSELEKHKLYTRVMSALTMTEVAEPFIRRRALRHLEKGRVVVFAGGTGSPYFSTDTAAALRASEINPLEMVKKDLRVMDLTAVALSMENKIPVIVFDAFKKGNLVKIIRGEKIGSEIRVH